MESKLFDLGKIIEGEYYPGTFLIGISKEFFDGMKYSDFSEEEMATFVHEYIHFLQDISTVAGGMNYNHKAKLLQLHFSLFQKNPDVNLPIDLEKCGVDNAYEQTELLIFYEGSMLEKRIHHINKVTVEKEELMTEILKSNSSSDLMNDIQQICIYFNDSDTPTVFGSHYVMESMAYLIERNLFGAEERIKEFPYNACEMVCEYLYPELLTKPEIIIALCELSLMHYHSGFEFYGLVRYLAEKKIFFNELSELYEYFSATAKMFLENHKNLVNEIIDNVNVMYPRDFPYMLVSNEYVKAYFKAGFNMRQHDVFFISALFEEKTPVEKIINWVDLFPVPIFVDNIKHNYFGAIEYLSMIPVPVAILQFFKNPSKGCPLLEYCKYSRIGVVEEAICKDRPWEQCNKEVKCPMAIYLIGFDIAKKKFIVNTKL